MWNSGGATRAWWFFTALFLGGGCAVFLTLCVPVLVLASNITPAISSAGVTQRIAWTCATPDTGFQIVIYYGDAGGSYIAALSNCEENISPYRVFNMEAVSGGMDGTYTIAMNNIPSVVYSSLAAWVAAGTIKDFVVFVRSAGVWSTVPATSDLTGFIICANEGQLCSFAGTLEVRYGANGVFFSRILTGGTPCTNAVFGDPTFGAPKSCYIPSGPPTITLFDPVSGSVGQTITITGTNFGVIQGTSQVKFSSTTASIGSWSNTLIQFIVPSLALGTHGVTVTTTAGTSNSVPFTINAPPTDVTGFIICANEGQLCSFAGTLEVRYGANGVFFSRILTGGTPCTNAVFGDPTFGAPKSCYIRESNHSNVLFLPGFGGSRLYDQADTRLWVALGTKDMCALRPNSDGSGPAGIHTNPGDIVDFAGGRVIGKDVYGGFVTFMNNLKTQRFLRDWRAMPYDWRLDVENIARNGMVGTIDELAMSSDTGKVTIITHSNGGLLVKELLRVLVEQGKANKVDRVIMVAAPQLGTPKAIASLLHGDDPFQPYTIDEAVFREAGENMIGGLNLLPSPEYFDRVSSPVIEFDPDASKPAELVSFRRTYGNNIRFFGTDSTGLRGFLLGADGRSEPFTGNCRLASGTDHSQPNVLRKPLLDRVQQLHTQQDSWQPPSGIRLFQVAGIGTLTPRGIRYTSERGHLSHTRLDTFLGDKTVVVPSATAVSATTFYLNIPYSNKETSETTEHVNIMTNRFIQELIRQLLDNNENPDGIHNISQDRPIGFNAVRMILRSPVEIHAYDSIGRHTGPAPNPEPQSEWGFLEDRIPNSSISRFAGDWYLTLDTSQSYQITLQGLALGTFTLILEEYSDDTLVAGLNYIDIPISPLSKGYLSVRHVAGSGSLQLDIDGDGISDLTVLPGVQPNAGTSLNIFTRILKSLGLPRGIENSLISKIEGAKSAVDRGNNNAAANVLEAFQNQVEAQRGKQIPTSTADGLLGISSTLLFAIRQ